MKTLFLIGAVLFSSLTFGQTLKEAIYKTDNERYADALKDFAALVKADPTNGEIYFYYGDCYFDKGLIDSAKMMWNKSIEVDKLRALPFVAAGRVLWLNGKNADAKLEFDKAMALTKKDKIKRAEVIRGMAKIFIKSENKDYDQALLLLEEAITKDPKNEDNLLLKGDALYAKTPDNASLAIKSYLAVLDINPKSARGVVRVAKIYQAAQNQEKANEMYKQAKQIDSTYAPAYRANAELNMLFGKKKAAIDDWQKYLKLNNNLEARYLYATALFNAKQYCEAINEVKYLNENNVTNFYTERMLAFSYLECNPDSTTLQNGLDASNRFFTIVPSNMVSYLDYKTRGAILMKQGKDSLGLLEYEKAISINDIAAKELTGEVASMYYKAKKFDKAIEFFTKRSKLVSLNSAEEYELGKALYSGPKDYVLADSAFARVNKLAPTYAQGYFWRARCYYKIDPNNEKWSAQPHCEKVIELIKPEDRATNNNKPMILEVSKYLADYYAKSPAKDEAKSIFYYELIYQLDPNNATAKQVLKAVGKIK
ncbi:MAG: tetratricopeptide repeat protein [Crocinitomicaceae bacterium]